MGGSRGGGYRAGTQPLQELRSLSRLSWSTDTLVPVQTAEPQAGSAGPARVHVCACTHTQRSEMGCRSPARAPPTGGCKDPDTQTHAFRLDRNEPLPSACLCPLLACVNLTQSLLGLQLGLSRIPLVEPALSRVFSVCVNPWGRGGEVYKR